MLEMKILDRDYQEGIYVCVTVSEKRVKSYKRFFHIIYTMIPMLSLRARVRESTTYTCLCWASRTFEDMKYISLLYVDIKQVLQSLMGLLYWHHLRGFYRTLCKSLTYFRSW